MGLRNHFAAKGEFRSSWRKQKHFRNHFEAWKSFHSYLEFGNHLATKWEFRSPFLKAWSIFAAHFAAAKWAYDAAKWHSCAKGWFRRGRLEAAKPFHSEGAIFAAGSLLLQSFAANALSLLFELLLIPNFLLSPFFFDIPLDFDHPKTYIT